MLTMGRIGGAAGRGSARARLARLAAAIIGMAPGVACGLSPRDAPPLAGPSELALSLVVSATPDLIAQDGRSQSLVRVVAKGPDGEPIAGLSLRLMMFLDGVGQDYGALADKSLSTDASGVAATIYRAPAPPPATATEDRVVEIEVLPVGGDFSTATPRRVRIRLAREGVILPPNPPLAATFFHSPEQPHESETVQFDATPSSGVVASYAWTFGDGGSGVGPRPAHVYLVAGTYRVTLTVTDDRGARASSEPTPVTVVPAPDPMASFAFSPTDPQAGDPVNFDGTGSAVPAGRTIVEYLWNFGDGSGGAGRTAAHRFDRASTYTVGLMVVDSAGRRGVTSRTVLVR